MIAVVSLLFILSMSLLITRIATVALQLTGLSKESARFQARSAFSGGRRPLLARPLRAGSMTVLRFRQSSFLLHLQACTLKSNVLPANGSSLLHFR